MPGLTVLADNPYLRGNPASALTPEQKCDGMFGAIAHTLIDLGSGISRASMVGQSWMAGVALKLWRQRNAVQGDPYLRMGDQ